MKTGPDRETGPVELTMRRCRYCDTYYTVPKGERWHACRRCAPTVMDAIAEAPEPPATPSRLPLGGEPDGGADIVSAVASIAVWPEPPPWWASECQIRHCSEPADVNAEGWLLCLGHADDWVERIEAIELYPAMRETLPDLDGS